MKTMLTLVAASALLLLADVRADVSSSEPVPEVEGELAGRSIEDVAFIAGEWQGELFGGVVDETWMAPRNGTMLGMMRLMWAEGRPNIYEFFVIEELDDGRLVMTFRHFSPQSELWEREKEHPNLYLLVDADDRSATFHAPDRTHDPARFVFLLSEDSNTLTVKVQGFNDDGSVREGFDVVYSRVECENGGS